MKQFQYYEINPKRPGNVIIINVKDFDPRSDMKERIGSERDVANLQALFAGLNFEVSIPKTAEGTTKTKFTSDEMLSCLEGYSKLRSHAEASMSVVVVMSHGVDNGRICDSDGKRVRVEEIIDKFTSENCRALDKKPKLFIFQACR